VSRDSSGHAGEDKNFKYFIGFRTSVVRSWPMATGRLADFVSFFYTS
jgi:hypothetical protein